MSHHRGYDYSRKRQHAATYRRREWWRIWPWVIGAAILTALAVYLVATR